MRIPKVWCLVERVVVQPVMHVYQPRVLCAKATQLW